MLLVGFALAVDGVDWFVPFIIGTVLGLIIDHRIIRRLPGVETFEHELTHAIVALLFFRKIVHFRVTAREGGGVIHRGNFGGIIADDMIGLAPYLLPTFTLILVLLRPLFFNEMSIWYDGAIGFTFGFHLWSTFREFGRNFTASRFRSAATGDLVQSDIAKRGFIYSFIFITTWTLAIHGFLLYILLDGYRGIGIWAAGVWDGSHRIITEMIANIGRLIG